MMTTTGSRSAVVCAIALVASSCAAHVALPAKIEGYRPPQDKPEALRGPLAYNPPDGIAEAIEVRGAVLTLQAPARGTMQVGHGLFQNPALANYELRFIKRAVAVSEDQAAELLRCTDDQGDALSRRDEREEILIDEVESHDPLQPWWAWLGEGVAAGLVLSVILVLVP